MTKTKRTASKLFALILAVVLLMAMSVPAIAASGTNEDTQGTITITNAEEGNTYSIYKIFDLESYDYEDGSPEDGAFSYTITSDSDWYNFVANGGDGASYVELTEHSVSGGVTTYYVTWNDDMTSAADIATFAKLAFAYADTNSVTPTETALADSGTDNLDGTYTIVFDELDLGYYLVGTTLGTLCSLDTTSPDVEIEEKNEEPTIEKEIVESEETTDSNTASIGDTVDYQVTIVAQEGAQGYTLHDTMSAGLTFSGSVEVELNDSPVDSENYNLTTETSDSCTFELSFVQSWLDTLEDGDVIVITYSAVINENAVTGEDPNTNEVYLDYGDGNTTETDETQTFTYTFDIVKTDSSYTLLDGAEFVLYDAETGGNVIELVEVSTGEYRVASLEEKEEPEFTSATIVVTGGRATVSGLGNGTYWLEETAAPDGYNKLDARVEVTIADANLSTSMTGDIWADGDGGVQITNSSGSLLPSTGGMGTTLIYIVGAALVLGAAVLLTIHVVRGKARKKAEE